MTQPPNMRGSTPPPAPHTRAVPPISYQPTADDRTMAMLIQLMLIIAPIVSLIVWLIKRDKSPFVEHHGKQALCFFIASALLGVITIVLCFFCVGIILLPVFLVVHILFPILAAVAANRGEWYIYPVVGRMF